MKSRNVIWLLLTIATLIPRAEAATNRDAFAYSRISSPDFFPILPWSPNHRPQYPFPPVKADGLESIAECNFNMAGFVLPKDLPGCEALGLGALVVPWESGATNLYNTREWRDLGHDEIERRVRALVAAAGDSPAVVGFYIMDEPGVRDFPALGVAVAAVKKHAPGKLAYINLFPDYATIGAPDKSQLGTSNYTDYLERFVTEVKPQVISYDNYTVETSMDLSNAVRFASYYRNMLEVRRVAQQHNLPFLNIVTSNQIRPWSTPPSPANLQFHVYTTLAAGFRGISWFTYYQGRYNYAPIDTEGRKTLTWAWLKEVNRQVATLAPLMSGLKSTGVFFSAPAPVEGLPLLPGKLITEASCPAKVMVGEFIGSDGRKYAMIVNLSLEKSARFTLTTSQPAKEIRIISAMDGQPATYDQKEGHWLTAGQGLLLELNR